MSNNQSPAAKPVEKKLSATERLSNLENAAQSLFQLNDNLIKDILDIRKAVQLLHSKVTALAKASIQGEEPNDETLNRIMVEGNIEDLANKVTGLVEQGLLSKDETIGENAFVVGQELDDAGNVINPRLQFAVQALKPEVQAKLKGLKVGETVQIQDNLKFTVLESYNITPPKPETAPAPQADPSAPIAPVEAAPSEPPVQSN